MKYDITKVKGLALDIETDSESHKTDDNLNPFLCHIEYISFTHYWQEKVVTHGYFWHELSETEKEDIRIMLEDDNIKKIGHNIKGDLNILAHHLILNAKGIWFDTLLAYKMIDENRPADLSSIALELLDYKQEYPFPVFSKKLEKRFGLKYIKARNKRLALHCNEDSLMTWNCALKEKELLTSAKRLEWFLEYEMGTLAIMQQCEMKGAYVDIEYLNRLLVPYTEEFNNQLKTLKDLVNDENFNPSSPKQVIKHLFKDRTPLKFSEKTKEPSTRYEVLKYWADHHVALASEMIKYREIKSLKEFVEGLISATKYDGRIHSTFNTHGTETGRFKSKNPNLLNVTREGRGSDVRKAFSGNLIVGDFSQEELVICANMVGKGALYDAYINKVDIHQLTADKIGISRADAKIVNLGILYGKKSEYTDLWFQEYPEVKEWINGIIGEWIVEDREFQNFETEEIIKYKVYTGKKSMGSVYKEGYVTTIAGRQRHFPDIKKQYLEWYNFQAYDKTSRSQRKWLLNQVLHTEREAINSIMQGSGADIIKVAINNVYPHVQNIVVAPYDELVLEIDEKVYGDEQYLGVIRDNMLSVNEYFNLKPKLDVEIKFCKNWGEK